MKNLVEQLLESYAHCGGIKHLNGASLPSKMAVAALTQDLLHIIFPGFISEHQVSDRMICPTKRRLQVSGLHKAARSGKRSPRGLEMHPAVPGQWGGKHGAWISCANFPTCACLIQTDVEAAFQGDPRRCQPGS